MKIAQPVPEYISRTVLKDRRQEVEHCLAEFGLARGPRRLIRDIDTERWEATRTHRLRGALEKLGPVFSSFGRYLSTRVDLFTSQDRLELGAISDHANPSSLSVFQSLIELELGRPQDIFSEIQKTPLRSRLASQSHLARLNDGQEVVVTFTRPEIEGYLRRDLAMLPLLRVGLDDEAVPELAIENVIEDFVYTFRQQIGCIEQAESFSELIEDGEEFGMLKVPFVHEALCTSRLLTLEHVRGTPLSDAFLLTKEDEGVEAMFFARARLDREDLARRLCGLWLRQVFLGRFFPVDPSAANITVLPNRQLAFTSGPFERLPSGPKANISDYLTAVASDNLDRAYDCFFVELMKATPGGKQDDLRNRFRQIVPLRDSGWTAGGDGNSLAEYLFGHWRLATQRGHLPPPYLSSFYRGLFLIASVASHLSPERDALSEGLQDLRFFTGLEKFRDLVDPRYLGDHLEKYGAMMMQLPQRIDEVMTIASEGNTQLRIQLSEYAARSRMKNSLVRGIVLLLVLMGFALLSRRLTPLFPQGWLDAVNAVVFVALGGMLLRTASSA